MALKNNTWKLNQWYDQDVAGNVSYSGVREFWIWGQQEKGAFAQNSNPDVSRSSPVQIAGSTWQTDFYNAASQGNHHIMAKTDGTLWAWGKGSDWGQLGLNQHGPSIMYSSPVQIGSGTDWKLGGTTREGSFAIKTDGTLYTWGSNGQGLGLNDRTHRSSPTQVVGTQNYSVAFGSHSAILAIKNDGTLWAMGQNATGQLGDNSNIYRSSPVQIGSESNWVTGSMSADYRGNSAINSNGELFVWGYNNTGTLGQNDRTNRSSPTQVPGTTWRYVSAAGDGIFATKTDGTLWAWGSNTYGQLGQNQAPANLLRVSSPVQIPGTNWDRIRGCDGNGIATKTDGTLWTWGGNYKGELGLNDNAGGTPGATSRSSPTQVGTDTSWVNVGTHGQNRGLMAFKNV